MRTLGAIRPRRRPGLLREAGLLVLVALVLSALSWGLRPPRLPLRADASLYELDLEFPVVEPDAAVALYDANTHLLIDTRAEAVGGGRVPGAFLVRQRSFDADLAEIFDFLTPEDPLLLIGDGNLLRLSAVANRLRDRGYGNLTLMRGDLVQWAAAGGATAEAYDE